MPVRGQRTAELHVGGACANRCPLCDCGSPASSDADVRQALEGTARLTLRGTSERNPWAQAVVRRAREAGVREVIVRTNALAYQQAEPAAALARSGVDGVLVPIFSHVQVVHDRIAGRPGSFPATLHGLGVLAKAGLSVEIEVPLLSAKLQALESLVERVRTAAPGLKSVRFFVPSFSVPTTLAPPDWTEGGPRLARALRECRQHGVKVALSAAENIPLCALRTAPDLLELYRFNPRARSSTWGGNTLAATCGSCAVKAYCPGVARSYAEAHGEAGLVAWAQRPAELREQRNSPVRKWTPEERRAASKKQILVLRPTVNCNQDCTFCSANETTPNVWNDKDAMIRQIARAARTGVRRLSFSGGEPTLSKDLVSYVRTAARLGFEDIELVTNGVLLDSEKKVAALREAGLTNAFVSLHAHDERLSQVLTQKVGDHARTVRAIRLMVDAGVRTVLNHVITNRNYPYLKSYVEMAHREFGGRVRISFAFVTPQYKALEDLDQVPKLSDVRPYLRRALRRAMELHQPVVVGSRQGVPPCFLGEFRAWSDVFPIAANAAAEDAPQKTRGEACGKCRYQRQCQGLWKPYATRFGTGELAAVEGPAFTDEQVQEIWDHPYPQGVPMSFDEVPEILRDRAAEVEPLDEAPVQPMTRLPLFTPSRSRPLRLLMVGSGGQARRLARAASQVSGISLDAVASPHALEADLRDFGHCPVYSDAAEAMDDMRPEGVIIASSTPTHAALAQLALARRIPVLIEKPLAATEAEAEALLLAAGTTPVMVGHNDLHAVGLEEIFAFASHEGGTLSHARRRLLSSSDAPRTWNRSALSEVLYHAMSVLLRAAGTGTTEIVAAQFSGDSRPERLRAELRQRTIACELLLDFASTVEDDRLSRTVPGEPVVEMTWRRSGGSTTLATATSVRPVPSDGNDSVRMLARFRDLVLGKDGLYATAPEALAVMRATRLVLEALEAAGAPFDRSKAPKHVASKEFRPAF
jgi:cyclic pyranopterin phosphate synthase